jgi:hypothetical protein
LGEHIPEIARRDTMTDQAIDAALHAFNSAEPDYRTKIRSAITAYLAELHEEPWTRVALQDLVDSCEGIAAFNGPERNKRFYESLDAARSLLDQSQAHG